MPLPPFVHKRHLSSTTTTRSPVKRRKLLKPVSSLGKTVSPSSMLSSLRPSRPNMTASNSITLDMLRPHFEEPLAVVATSFGICVTLLKRICRRHGIARWPHRQITGMRKSIASMEHAIGYFEGDRRDSYAEQLLKQKNKLAALLNDPRSNNPLLASEMDQSDENIRRQTNELLLHGADDVYEVAPALVTRASSPTGPLLLESPYFYGESSGLEPLPPSPMWLPPIEYSCNHPYQELYLPSVPKQSQLVHYLTPNYRPASVSNNCPIYLPPLRSESRGVLPPFSSLVTSNNEAYASTAMPAMSW